MEVKALEEALREDGCLSEESYRGHPNQCVPVDDVNRVGYKMLEADACSFMSASVEVVLDETAGMSEPISGDRAVFLWTQYPMDRHVGFDRREGFDAFPNLKKIDGCSAGNLAAASRLPLPPVQRHRRRFFQNVRASCSVGAGARWSADFGVLPRL